jgi:hypothetical protein
VVREHPQQACSLLWPPSASTQCRSHASVVAGQGAFALPTWSVHPGETPPRPLAPILGVRPIPLTPWMERALRRPERPLVTAPWVVVFGIIGRIRHETVPLRGCG